MTSVPEHPIETPRLTPLQHEILVLVVNGLTNREIATRLGLTPGTVATQIGRIVQRLSRTCRSELQGAVAMRDDDLPGFG